MVALNVFTGRASKRTPDREQTPDQESVIHFNHLQKIDPTNDHLPPPRDHFFKTISFSNNDFSKERRNVGSKGKGWSRKKDRSDVDPTCRSDVYGRIIMTAGAYSSAPRRLSPSDIRDIRQLWHEYEAAIGFRSNFHDAFSGATSVDYDEWLADRAHTATKAVRRTWLILSKLPPWAQRVLWRTYGPQNHHAPYGVFGELAPIVEYTDQAERLAARLGVPVRAAIEARLKNAEIVASLRIAAENLLVGASNAYRNAKEAVP